MVGLLDLAPSTRTVPVGGGQVAVLGVSALGIAAILTQFPELKKAFSGGELKFDAESLMAYAPNAISAILAAGCGYPGNPAAITKAASLPVGEQAALLDVILELTMPDGIGPFVEALTKIMDRLNFADRGKAPDSKLASPSKPL